jgi:hypothetical protein
VLVLKKESSFEILIMFLTWSDDVETRINISENINKFIEIQSGSGSAPKKIVETSIPMIVFFYSYLFLFISALEIKNRFMKIKKFLSMR